MKKIEILSCQILNSTLRNHNYDSLIAIAKMTGVEQKGKDCQSFSEYREQYSLCDAKKLIYRALIWRLFDDSHADYGHALTILGLDEDESRLVLLFQNLILTLTGY